MPPRWVRRLLLTGVVAAAAVCAAGTVAAGPLGGSGNLVGVRSPDGGPVTISYPLPNLGPGTITVDHVRLLDPDGITLEAALVLPGRFVIGGPFPPDLTGEQSQHLRPAWSRRVDAVGARVPPGRDYDLAVGLQPAHQGRSSIKGVEIAYTEGGRSYRLASRMEVTICVGPRCALS
ncbi:hypothetical protein [Jiangella mangrovi]|uniref:Uncharacterized protein n=1 Tax=Jiangella mangrovi TaxID=1524084 RepID=A0A7W9GSV7_9ACTN|nr:hypothetical protein [Jiangella mangrovi]MBB5789096.1 hypothetical protein [Jiangella mangrovi]